MSLFEMSKFFDTLNKKARIDAKSYRMLYKLNENTKISVKTSVGESKTAPIDDSIGQGSFSAALSSSLNIGCAIASKLEDDNSQHRPIIVNCSHLTRRYIKNV